MLRHQHNNEVLNQKWKVIADRLSLKQFSHTIGVPDYKAKALIALKHTNSRNMTELLHDLIETYERLLTEKHLALVSGNEDIRMPRKSQAKLTVVAS